MTAKIFGTGCLRGLAAGQGGYSFDLRLNLGLFIAGILIFSFTSSLRAQVGQGPVASDAALDTETDISSIINTGSGYDAWSGAATRHVTDFAVPGAVSDHGLKWDRTYSSSTNQWSFAYTWRVYGQPWNPYFADFPDGRETHFGAACKERLFVHGSGSQGGGSIDLYLQDGSSVHNDWIQDTNNNDTGRVDYITPLYLQDRHGRQTTLDWQIMSDGDLAHIQLVQITDPSGRWIKITYGGTNQTEPTLVQGSDGQWVNYTWTSGNLTHVDYSDGTSADYTYGVETYWPGKHYQAWVMLTARDTHADGPMQSIAYDYNSQGVFPGQVLNERYFDGSPGVNVSTLTSNATHGALNSVQTETRGDGPSRTIKMVKLTGSSKGRPFVTYKCDYDGVHETYSYNGNYFVNAITDRRGYTTNFTLESIIGNVTRKTHPDGTYINYVYSDSFYPYYIGSVTDENGKTTTYTRNPVGTFLNPVANSGLITRIDYPDGAYETFTYNNLGQVITHQRKNGAYEYAVYDSTGLLTQLSNPTAGPNGTEWTTFTYYAANDPIGGSAWIGRLKSVTPPANAQGLVNEQVYEYDRALGTDGLTDPLGTPVPGRGLVTKISYPNDTHPGETPTYPNGTFKSSQYDQFGNKRTETDELGHTTQYMPDAYKRLVRMTDALGDMSTNDYTATNGSSSYSHTTKAVRFATSPAGIVTAQTFDNNMRVVIKTQAYNTSVAATTRYGYDPNGNKTSVTDPRNYTTSAVYDNRNRSTSSTDPLNHTTSLAYDSATNVLTVTRPDNTKEIKTYDGMNRVLTDTDSLNRTTSLAYNPSGTIDTVTDANGHITTFSYDASDHKTQMLYQNGDHQDYAYDDDYNLTSRRTTSTSALGVYQVFTYDARNRKLSMGWHDANSADITWANGINTSTFLYDAASRLTSANNGFSQVSRRYDDANRLTHDIQLVSGYTSTDVQYTYDADGKVTHVGVPSAYDLTIGYDSMGRFLDFTDSNLGNVAHYVYDASSNVTGRNAVANGLSLVYLRDALNRIYHRDVKVGASTISSEAYGFDAISRLTSVNRTEDGKEDMFGYSTAGELTSGQYGLVNGVNPNRTVGYTLDKVGNRTNVNENGVDTPYTPDNINRYMQVGTDSVGSGPDHEIGAYQTNSYQYIGDTYLAQVAQGSNTYTPGYDALGRCVIRTLSGNPATYYIYDGDKAILEAGTVSAINIYGASIDEIVARVESGTTAYYFAQDHEGSVTHVFDASGTLVEQYRYDAFGAPTIKDGHGYVITNSGINNRFMFTGREYVATFGIYEYRNRAYHPGLGRFMSEDPKGFDAGDYNLFRYVKNDPEDLVDPMGLDGELWAPDKQNTPEQPIFSQNPTTDPAHQTPQVSKNADTTQNAAATPNNFSLQNSNRIGLDLKSGVPTADPANLKNLSPVPTVTVTLYPGAGVFGHVGVGIDTSQTTGFYPQHDSLGLLEGKTVPGAMRTDNSGGIESRTIEITHTQEMQMSQRQAAQTRDPGGYNLYNRSCVNAAGDTLRAGGIAAPRDTIYPRVFFHELFNSNREFLAPNQGP